MQLVLATTMAALLLCGAAQAQTAVTPTANPPAANPPATAAPASPAKPVSAAQQAQRDRMRDCNADARTRSLKGDERKTFMSNCLRRPAQAEPAARTN